MDTFSSIVEYSIDTLNNYRYILLDTLYSEICIGTFSSIMEYSIDTSKGDVGIVFLYLLDLFLFGCPFSDKSFRIF